MRRNRHAAVVAPGSEEPCGDERRHAGADVDDRAAREVQRAALQQPTARAPHPVRQRIVDQCRPQDEEHDVTPEAHPLHDGARDEGGGDDREHPLEHGVGLQRDRRRIGRVGLESNVVQAEPCEAAEPRVAGTERDRVADEHPLNADDAERDHAHHHRIEGVLGTHQTAVEERETDGHQEHERAGDEDPASITR